MTRIMYATLIGPAEDPRPTCAEYQCADGTWVTGYEVARASWPPFTRFPYRVTGSKPIEPGDLVRVKIPHNCAVYDASPVGAREIARSWFDAGQCSYQGGDFDDAEFDRLWDAGGITGALPEGKS